MIKKGVQVGGVATFIYAFIKQLLKKDTLENTLTKILNGILDSSTLKTAVKKILEGYSLENEDEKNTEIISEVIKSSTAFSSEECKTMSEIIINSLNSK
jgi:DNA gyrase inhibitor GyrI